MISNSIVLLVSTRIGDSIVKWNTNIVQGLVRLSTVSRQWNVNERRTYRSGASPSSCIVVGSFVNPTLRIDKAIYGLKSLKVEIPIHPLWMITEIHSKRVCYVFILTSKLVKWTRNLCESALKSRSWRWKVNSLSYKKSENSPKNKQNNQYILDVSNTSQTGEERGVSKASYNEVSSTNETRHRRDYWHVVEKLE